MNCCDEYGNCKGGTGCPVGELPVQFWNREEPEEDEPHISELLWLSVLVLIIFLTGFTLGRVF